MFQLAGKAICVAEISLCTLEKQQLSGNLQAVVSLFQVADCVIMSNRVLKTFFRQRSCSGSWHGFMRAKH